MIQGIIVISQFFFKNLCKEKGRLSTHTQIPKIFSTHRFSFPHKTCIPNTHLPFFLAHNIIEIKLKDSLACGGKILIYIKFCNSES